ncbi:MAG TPA: methanogenesis marker 14 protein [Methanoregulaceae archaeon]|nr:methanogenesis marker 14 protein [Methanoregulaceae archaeon]
MPFGVSKPVIPYILEDTPVPVFLQQGGIAIPEYREKPYYVVLSVDFGNTVTDCIIVGTNLETGITYTIINTARLTYKMRPPKEGERVLGHSFEGIPISQAAVVDFVRDIVQHSIRESNIDPVKDLNFAVYCTGLVGTWNSSADTSAFISGLAKGCMEAGIPGSKFSPPMTKQSLHAHIQKYSLADKVTFCGTIAGAIPISKISGDVNIANDMEGDLGMAGIKEGALHSPVDFRNPCVSIDFGTILDGRITGPASDDEKNPYSQTIGCFVGLGGIIADVMVRGTGEVDPLYGSAYEFFGDKIETGWLSKKEKGVIKKYVDQIHDYITISTVPRGTKNFGIVPLDEDISSRTGITIMGVDSGRNFSNKETLRMLGADIYKQEGKKTLSEVVDRVCARIAIQLIDMAIENDLIHPNSAIGFSGRGAMSGRKPEYILENIRDRKLYKDPMDRVIFVASALPRGASLMARCMASLGRPEKPIGGQREGRCIMGKRIKAAK